MNEANEGSTCQKGDSRWRFSSSSSSGSDHDYQNEAGPKRGRGVNLQMTMASRSDASQGFDGVQKVFKNIIENSDCQFQK